MGIQAAWDDSESGKVLARMLHFDAI